MKRPTCRGSSMAIIQDTSDQQEDNMRSYMDGAAAVYGEEEEEEVEDDDEELGRRGEGGGGGGLGEKKRRLAAEQVRALERSFEADNKLDPERKSRIARDLRLHPRQVAVWFQNRRARWKTKQIERDFAALRSRHDALRLECDSLRRDKDALAAEIMELREKVDRQMSVKLEAPTDEQPPPPPPPPLSAAASAGRPAAYNSNKDGSTDSDSSAVFNEEASPYSGAAIEHHHHQTPASYDTAGFTSFFAPSTTLTSSLSFPSMFHGSSHFDGQELLAGAAADADLGGSGFFASDEHAGGLSWYGPEGW